MLKKNNFTVLILQAVLSSSLFMSLNLFATEWQALPLTRDVSTIDEFSNLFIDPKNPAQLYVDIYKSADSGKTWQTLRANRQPVFVFAVNPQTPSILYGNSHTSGLSDLGKAYKSTDSGASWDAMTQAVIALDPKNPSILYSKANASLYKSIDDGNTWTLLQQGLDVINKFGLLIDPQNPSVLYASGRQFPVSNGKLGSSSAAVWGVFKSVNGGTTWQRIWDKTAHATWLIDPHQSDTLYVSKDEDMLGGRGHLYKTTDGGKTWVEFSNYLTAAGVNLETYSVQTLVADPKTPNTLYAGISRSVWAGNTGQGVYKTTDGGMTWTAMNAGFPANTAVGVKRLVIDPSNNNRLYANTQKGIFVWDESPATTNIPKTLPNLGSTVAEAAFFGGIAVNGAEAVTSVTQQLSDEVTIQGQIQAVPAHIGQTVDLVVYARFSLPDTPDFQPVYFMLQNGTNILLWNQDAEQLTAFKQAVTLTDKLDLTLYTGQFVATGALNISFGYRLADGTLVLSEKTLDVTITDK
ncbi:VPS10 domain-containing protein [Beggiatoa leptomitoformis]|uniref:Sortilin N-terminal domain-containing protein n=1 Tax=Beggiatoa leptomitoformis TaxID=288004 RepID=A0A2N9YDG6_9GAMM|nr:hypothetical protein [Beggiatoa leptomitoformis]ALG69049.1 hypothetical protein AL038_16865 [Beggiatoa leptomitoformis]AUI68542.1 hypothetical protein BLE401_07375 [Beggiatoa leptomitoformis]